LPIDHEATRRDRIDRAAPWFGRQHVARPPALPIAEHQRRAFCARYPAVSLPIPFSGLVYAGASPGQILGQSLSTQADLAEFDKRSIALDRIARYDVMVSFVKDEGAYGRAGASALKGRLMPGGVDHGPLSCCFAARAAIHDDGVWCRVAGIVARGKVFGPTLGDQAMRAITDEEIESALRGGAQRVEFCPGEQARIPGGQVTFIGSIVDAVSRITAGLGPRDYGNVLDVATYNKLLAVAIQVREPKG